MGCPKRGTPEYEAWILTPEYKVFSKKCSVRCFIKNNGFPKKGTLEYEAWILTPEYEEFCKKKSTVKRPDNIERNKLRIITGSMRGKNNPNFGRTGSKHPLFGTHRSEEQRRKQSERMAGDKNPMYGMCGELSPAFGLHLTRSEETRKNISISKTGDKNPNYIDGRSFIPYPQIFDEFFRKQNRVRFGDVCLFPGCGATQLEIGEALSVHHYDYDKNSLNCVPLCRTHNVRVNAHREEWEEYFTSVVRMYLEWCGRGNWQCKNINVHSALYLGDD